MSRISSQEDLSKLRKKVQFQRNAKELTITICAGTGCRAYGAEALADAFEKEIDRRGIGHRVAVRRSGCHGFCERGPLVLIQPKGICYLGAQVKDVAAIVDSSVERDDIIERLLYVDPETGKRVALADEIPFYKHQKRILMENNALIDPTSILDYIAVGGYTALAKALNAMSPEKVLNEVKNANLRGRGGAGFAAGRKWPFATGRSA